MGKDRCHFKHVSGNLFPENPSYDLETFDYRRATELFPRSAALEFLTHEPRLRLELRPPLYVPVGYLVHGDLLGEIEGEPVKQVEAAEDEDRGVVPGAHRVNDQPLALQDHRVLALLRAGQKTAQAPVKDLNIF